MQLRKITVAAVLCVALAGCEPHSLTTKSDQVQHGADLIAQNQCGLCHTIPGIAGADGLIGPPLDHIAKRTFLAGVLRNTPENMAAWLRHPQNYVPGNAMPEMGIDEPGSQAMTSYLEMLD